MPSWYSVPDAGFERIRNKVGAMRLGGQTVTPQMIEAMYRGEMQSVQDEATRRRALDLHNQQFYNDQMMKASRFQDMLNFQKKQAEKADYAAGGKLAVLGADKLGLFPWAKKRLGGLLGTDNSTAVTDPATQNPDFAYETPPDTVDYANTNDPGYSEGIVDPGAFDTPTYQSDISPTYDTTPDSVDPFSDANASTTNPSDTFDAMQASSDTARAATSEVNDDGSTVTDMGDGAGPSTTPAPYTPTQAAAMSPSNNVVAGVNAGLNPAAPDTAILHNPTVEATNAIQAANPNAQVQGAYGVIKTPINPNTGQVLTNPDTGLAIPDQVLKPVPNPTASAVNEVKSLGGAQVIGKQPVATLTDEGGNVVTDPDTGLPMTDVMKSPRLDVPDPGANFSGIDATNLKPTDNGIDYAALAAKGGLGLANMAAGNLGGMAGGYVGGEVDKGLEDSGVRTYGMGKTAGQYGGAKAAQAGLGAMLGGKAIADAGGVGGVPGNGERFDSPNYGEEDPSTGLSDFDAMSEPDYSAAENGVDFAAPEEVAPAADTLTGATEGASAAAEGAEGTAAAAEGASAATEAATAGTAAAGTALSATGIGALVMAAIAAYNNAVGKYLENGRTTMDAGAEYNEMMMHPDKYPTTPLLAGVGNPLTVEEGNKLAHDWFGDDDMGEIRGTMPW